MSLGSSTEIRREGSAGKVSESVGVMGGITTAHRDEGERKEDEDQDDFTSREPEFEFAVETDRKDVDESIEASQLNSPPVVVEMTYA